MIPAESHPSLESYLQRPVEWEETRSAEEPFMAMVGGQLWHLRLGDYPREPFYTLFVNGARVGAFDDWPEPWIR